MMENSRTKTPKLDFRECQVIVQDIALKTSTSEGPVILANLLRLLSCLESRDLSTRELSLLRHQIWQCDLIHLIIEILRNDFSSELDGWRKLTNLAVTLASIVASIAPREPTNLASKSNIDPEQVKEYYDIILPTTADSLLILANNILETVDANQDKAGVNFPECFKKVLDSLLWVCANHKQCIFRTLQSPYLLHMIITDHHIYSHMILTALESLILTDKPSTASLPHTAITVILDELVYKLSGEEQKNALLSLRLLAQFFLLVPHVLDSLSTSYSSLLMLVRKWTSSDSEIGPAEKYLISELESRTGREGVEEKHKAALMIQAAWKGYVGRRRVVKMKKGIQKFQQLYRRKKAEKLREKEVQEKMTMVTSFKKNNLQSTQLAFHEKQMSLYEQLPASELQTFIHMQENEAAVKIQSIWRAWRVRSQYGEVKSKALKLKSIISIQRCFRKYLERKKNRIVGKFEALPDIRGPTRQMLQLEITRYKETRPPNKYSTQQEISELHHKGQRLYEEFCLSRENQRRQDEHLQLLLSKLDRNCELLLSAPSLNDSYTSASIAEDFSSSSSNIAKMARTAHREEMKAMNSPWWKKDPFDHELTL